MEHINVGGSVFFPQRALNGNVRFQRIAEKVNIVYKVTISDHKVNNTSSLPIYFKRYISQVTQQE